MRSKVRGFYGIYNGTKLVYCHQKLFFHLHIYSLWFVRVGVRSGSVAAKSEVRSHAGLFPHRPASCWYRTPVRLFPPTSTRYTRQHDASALSRSHVAVGSEAFCRDAQARCEVADRPFGLALRTNNFRESNRSCLRLLLGSSCNSYSFVVRYFHHTRLCSFDRFCEDFLQSPLIWLVNARVFQSTKSP
jgi:hypothetical protein